jgi:hypothetical protein
MNVLIRQNVTVLDNTSIAGGTDVKPAGATVGTGPGLTACGG